MLSYNLPWSPQKYNVSDPGSGWFLFWKWVEEGISAALKKYLPPCLAVECLLSCSSLSVELLGTLDEIAPNGFFCFLCTISVAWVVSRCLQAIVWVFLFEA